MYALNVADVTALVRSEPDALVGGVLLKRASTGDHVVVERGAVDGTALVLNRLPEEEAVAIASLMHHVFGPWAAGRPVRVYRQNEGGGWDPAVPPPPSELAGDLWDSKAGPPWRPAQQAR